MSTPIEILIEKDLETFIPYLSKKNQLNTDTLIELSSHIAANFMRLIYTKQKSIAKEEINGVIGIISNLLNDWFENQLTKEDYISIQKKSLDLLKDTGFDEKQQIYFRNLIS